MEMIVIEKGGKMTVERSKIGCWRKCETGREKTSGALF